MDSASTDLLKQEFTEAWNHYRHLENDRTRYLGFFFTLLIASIGLLLNALATVSPTSPTPYWFVPGVFLLAWLFDALSLFIYANIKKSAFILRHYFNIMWRIRELIYEDPPKMHQLLSVAETHPIVKSMWFSHQKLSEMLLLSACFLLDVAQAVLIALGWRHHLSPHWVVACMAVLAVALLSVQAIVFGKAVSFSRKEQPLRTVVP